MTIPILPGPFSFLAPAGQALGAYGQAQTAEQHYQNTLALERQQAALANAALLQRILNPTAFAAGGPGGAALQAAGIQAPTEEQIYTPPDVLKGQLLAKQVKGVEPLGVEARGLTGFAQKSDILAEQNKAAVEEVLSTLTPEQIKAARNIKSPELIAALDRLDLTKARNGLIQSATDVKEAQAKGAVFDAVMQRLPNNEFFRKVATYAAVGGTPVLAAQIEAAAKIEAEKIGLNAADVRTLNNTLSIAAQEYRADAASWDKGLQQAIRDRLGIDVSEIDRPEYIKKSNEVIQDYTSQHGKRPTPDLYMDYLLRKGGVSLPQFQGAYGTAMRVDQPDTAAPLTLEEMLSREGETRYDVVKRLYVGGRLGKTKAESDARIDEAEGLTPKQKAEIKALNIIPELLTPKSDVGGGGKSNQSLQIRTRAPFATKAP